MVRRLSTPRINSFSEVVAEFVVVAFDDDAPDVLASLSSPL